VYTVKQLSELAGVSVRTLHCYDEIGLFEPSRVGENGYRYYADESVFRLQQILFFRELNFSLSDIKEIMDKPDFNLLAALHTHRKALQDRIKRLNDLVQTVDSTILHLTGEITMSKKRLFQGFTEEEEKRYAQEAREAYGEEAVNESYKLWNSYTSQQKERIGAEGQAIYEDLVALIQQEKNSTSPEVQAVIARWHQHLRYFYEPSVERLLGLGQLYVEHPDFARNFRELHPNLPEFMREAITHYCDGLQPDA
jgi:DNA-binding transcriptional MerR regulator